MADSVRERIMKNIQTTLEAITVANGYANTLNAVERVLQRGQSSQPPMAYVLEGDDDVIAQAPLGYLSRNLNVGILLVEQQDDAIDARSASEVMSGLIADVQTAMMLDHRRGDLAINTEEVAVSPIQIEEGQPLLMPTIAYRIHYRHLLTDPSVAG